MNKNSAISIVLFLFMTHMMMAQKVTIPVETNHNALVLQVDEQHHLTMIYLGNKLSNSDEYRFVPQAYHQAEDISGLMTSAYTPAGSRNLLEPALEVTHADGNKSLDLVYLSHRIEKISADVSLLSVKLKDPAYNFEVTLYYKSFFRDDIIEQWSMIRHNEKGNVILHKFASANLSLKSPAFWLTQYHGDWAKEMRPEESQLTHGIKTLDSKLGSRANMFQPSAFMISMGSPASEDQGTVLLGSLEWSGNFRTDLEIDPQENLRIISGINNYASPYLLKAGEPFVTPAFLFTLSGHGRGEASRNLQRWAREYKLLDGKETRLTVLNNWESTFFEFDEARLKSLIGDAKKLGVDMFLLDDGWFGNKYPRNGDAAGLGDWQENRKKLPHGIATLVKEAQKNGIGFGIWVEPEMVNPKSELYEKHPDWVIKQPHRDEYYMRNQLVLDLTNPKVQDFVYDTIDNLFSANPGLSYIKWDCNSIIYNAYSATIVDQSRFYVEYVRGLYKVLAKVRAKYPHVPMMLCSGGGSRIDYGALQYFTEFWPSDNTDPIERIFMQWEYSYFFPAIATSNHVTDWGKEPIKFRTDVAMMGKLGFDIVVSKLSAPDLRFVQMAVELYNKIKPIIFQGEQYRLSNPRQNSIASISYVNQDKTSAVVFNYLVNNRFGEGSPSPIIFKGLLPEKIYRVSEINLYPGQKSLISATDNFTGEFLMKIGFNPLVSAERTSVMLKVDAQ